MNQSSPSMPSPSSSISPLSTNAWARITRKRPSAPMPARRSHKAATRAASSDSSPSGSLMMRKSFSVPWPLANGNEPVEIVAITLILYPQANLVPAGGLAAQHRAMKSAYHGETTSAADDHTAEYP